MGCARARRELDSQLLDLGGPVADEPIPGLPDVPIPAAEPEPQPAQADADEEAEPAALEAGMAM